MGFFDVLADIIKSKQDKKDGSVVVKNYINGNNSNNSNNSNNNKNNTNNTRTQRRISNNKITNDKIYSQISSITLEKIRLYCTGVKGKVFTTTFRKSINHNFGIEVVIKNNTSQTQTVKLGHCIYDESGKNTIFQSTFYPKIKPYSTLTENIYVDAKAFSKMKKGKYKSQFWINDQKVQKVFFEIKEK